MGEVIPFGRSGNDPHNIVERLDRIAAQAAGMAANCEIANECLDRAAKRGEQLLEFLGALLDTARRTEEFCRQCHDASELDDLAVMIERRDRLAKELVEKRPAEIKIKQGIADS